MLVPLIPGGAKRLRAFLGLLHGNLKRGGDLVGTLHNMRFVFLENDTKLLFATTYDGEWDAYIDDFATKIPDYLDLIDSAWEGWPGIRSPQAKDYIASHQVTAEGWYVAHPDVSVAEVELRVRRFLETTPVNFPVLLDQDRAVAKAWKVSTLPSTVILDSALKPRLAAEGDFAWDRIEPGALIDLLKQKKTQSITTFHPGG